MEASRPGRFTPEETSSGTPLDRRLEVPQRRSGRGGEEKNIPAPYRELNLGRPTHSLVTILTAWRVFIVPHLIVKPNFA
jgi:hypothetical protein